MAISETVAGRSKGMHLDRKPVLAPKSVKIVRQAEDLILGGGEEKRTRVLRHLSLCHRAIHQTYKIRFREFVVVIQHIKGNRASGREAHHSYLGRINSVLRGILPKVPDGLPCVCCRKRAHIADVLLVVLTVLCCQCLIGIILRNASIGMVSH